MSELWCEGLLGDSQKGSEKEGGLSVGFLSGWLGGSEAPLGSVKLWLCITQDVLHHEQDVQCPFTVQTGTGYRKKEHVS